MEYKHIRTTAALRSRNSIKAHKILAIEGNSLIFQLWLNSDEQERLTVSMPEQYEIGQYIDLQVIRTSKTSYQIHLIGRTPQKFIPADGRNIAL